MKNYLECQQGFERAERLRKDAGEIEYQVLKYENNDNKIVYISKWKSLVKAQIFLNRKRLYKFAENSVWKSQNSST